MPLDAFPLRAIPPTGRGALRRIGTLAARTWRAKLYAPACDVDGLRPEDVASAERAYRAGIAAPVPAPVVAGFALLRFGGEDGGLALSSYWWEDAELHRVALRLLRGDGPPRRGERAAGLVGDVDEILLMACEAAAWRRCVLDASPPSPDAYLAECCA